MWIAATGHVRQSLTSASGTAGFIGGTSVAGFVVVPGCAKLGHKASGASDFEKVVGLIYMSAGKLPCLEEVSKCGLGYIWRVSGGFRGTWVKS